MPYHVTFHTRGGGGYHACDQAGYDSATEAVESVRRVIARGFAGSAISVTITDDLPAHRTARIVAQGTVEDFWHRRISLPDKS